MIIELFVQKRSFSGASYFFSFLFDFCSLDAAKMLMQCDKCIGGLFSANFGLKRVKGICDAFDVFTLELTDWVGSVDCDAIGNEVLWVGKWNAIDLIWICELSFFKSGVCNAIGPVECSKDKFYFRMLSNLWIVCVYV